MEWKSEGDGARGARTWRPARGRGQGRLLRGAAAPRAGAAASMAPSPRTSSRQDATALPSMSSTFWAFMILASLLIAYCSEYRAAGPPHGPSAPAPSPGPGPGPGGLPAGRPESVRSCELGARGPPDTAGPPLGRGGEGPPGLSALGYFGGGRSCPGLHPPTPGKGPCARPRVARRVPELRCPRLPSALPPLPALAGELPSRRLPGPAARSGGGGRSEAGGQHCWGCQRSALSRAFRWRHSRRGRGGNAEAEPGARRLRQERAWAQTRGWSFCLPGKQGAGAFLKRRSEGWGSWKGSTTTAGVSGVASEDLSRQPRESGAGLRAQGWGGAGLL